MIRKDEKQMPSFRYCEDKSIKELYDYIVSTYGQHYARDAKSFQAFDGIIQIDDKEAWRFFRGCCFKYMWRFGRKDGFNRKDLLKAAHYIMLLMFLTKDRNEN